MDSFIQQQGVHSCVGDSLLEHLCLLDIDQEPIAARNTGIICTIGPASRSVLTLQAMVKAGMNIARLNFSHGTHQYHRESIRNIREAVGSLTSDPLTYRPVAIALDTKGPEIRTGLVHGLADGEVNLERGSLVTLVTAEAERDVTDGSRVWVDYPDLSRVVKTGGTVYIDDGLIALTVLHTGDGWVETRVDSGGILCSRKGVNLPGAELVNLPAVSEQDRADLQLGVDEGVDIVFASFIRCAEDVRAVRKALGPSGAKIKVISKVENRQGVQNFDEILSESEGVMVVSLSLSHSLSLSLSLCSFDEILSESDGVMVARGDLGIEIPAEKVFIAQKMMIGRCNSAGKPVICATQMLESMVYHARPTRAESSDVANAVLDGADCVMLSAETAKGRDPVEAVYMMHSICREAEAALFHQRVFEDLRRLTDLSSDPTEVTAIGAVESSFKCNAGAIIVLTTSGRSAHLLSRYRPRCPIIAVTRNAQMARQSQLLRGIFPAIFQVPPAKVWADDVDNRVNFGLDIGKAQGFFKPSDLVIIVTGWSPGSGHTNIMRVVTVP
ncbi:pyruvate kinase PKLR isoform X1 [Tachysurus fulvidraco]|uniref:pyruvate kinase PKLR isoform X1 n=1 Tax=Tachysurus fulvidraco TaxID=1234273 RepID=UPI001FF023A3|nr:pyruvate kinase PKLR isoform X1 [Tachysurus fulvidraco]XP_047667188.1 pyruvate kinase PKLR isoform X1 [Tachysurus fulvidraco]